MVLLSICNDLEDHVRVMKTISIVGAGKVGRTFGRLAREGGHFTVQTILNRSMASAAEAAEFIGAGEPSTTFDDLEGSDIILIAVADDALASVARSIARAQADLTGKIVFHCSGSKSSGVLEPLRNAGANTGSLHPVKSFASATAAVASFPGTFCAIEGDPAAIAVMTELVSGMGGRVFQIDPDKKLIYHAANVFVCNYLMALMETGLTCFQAAGVTKDQATAMIEPIVRETLDNFFDLGPARGLTGPVARGDKHLVGEQLARLADVDPELAHLYAGLGKVALKLSSAKGVAASADLDAISELFAES